MRRVVLLSVLTFVAVAAIVVFGQQESQFFGRYEDLKLIPGRVNVPGSGVFDVVNNTKDTDQFVFTRLIYNGRIPGYYKGWYTDFPNADHHLITVIKRLTNIDIADEERVVPINDAALFKYPFVYSSEEGQLTLTAEDAADLREYLTRGGFWVLDDFWGSFEWASMEGEMKKIFPDREIRDIPRDHPIFHVMYDIPGLMQVPSLAYLYNGGITWETDGFEAECKGIFDDKGRLMVVINHNSDLGDAYEWSDEPRYPNRFSDYAYRMALNFVMYALTH